MNLLDLLILCFVSSVVGAAISLVAGWLIDLFDGGNR